jgi:pimeloyl-ACP methyl ester carboxylesterase
MIPAVGRPGELAGMSSEESEPGMRAIAGPTWRNEVTGRAVFAEWTNRAITRMDKVQCPILVVIADRDSVAPSAAARAAAWRAKGRAEVRDYPCLHFDIYQGEWRERSIADQLHFLRRHLAVASEAEGESRFQKREPATAAD